jgi:hypothetical protein
MYDSSERFSNWQVGGAAVVVEPVIEIKVSTVQQSISENFRLFVLAAEHNDFDFTAGLYRSLTEYDWFVIWSSIEQPEDWSTTAEDINIEYLLCDCYEDLVFAIEAEDEFIGRETLTDADVVEMLSSAIAYADESKAIAQQAVVTLDANCVRLTEVADAALAKYPLL